MGKKILVISQCFYPEIFRINNICQEWVQRGYDVEVITGIPNYPQGKFFPGYGWFKKRKDLWQGISITRLPLIPRGSNSFMLVLNYLSFLFSGFIWKTFTRTTADIVFTVGLSPLTQALPGVCFAKRNKVPCYIYVQDLWPENVTIMTGLKNKFILKHINKMMDYIYNGCELIFAASNSFVFNISGRGIKPDKIRFWPQYADDSYKPNAKQKIVGISEKAFTMVFAGNIGYAQGLEILPKAASLLSKYHADSEIQFVVIGNGRFLDKLLQEIEDSKVGDYFYFIPQQPSEEIPKYFAACDVAFLSLAANPVYEMTVPAKLQSHMACGIPTIAAASGETKQIIESSRSGICVKPGDASELVDVLVRLSKEPRETIEDMGRNARSYYIKNYQKSKLFDKMDAYFAEYNRPEENTDNV